MCFIGRDTNKLLIQKKKYNLKNLQKQQFLNWNQGISFLEELGNNQIKELPPRVFNNNTELIKLYVTCLFW